MTKNRFKDEFLAPILQDKHYQTPSVFTAQNLLREARRQKGLDLEPVPPVCVLDPDGDLVDYLQTNGLAERHKGWACYHTELNTFFQDELEFGIVGRVVGAPFAVLVAEELFASGCQLLISITSAGQVHPVGQPPYVVLIEKAWRDEGTSYHYLPPSEYSFLNPAWKDSLLAGWNDAGVALYCGASWTTDAPFRETEQAIAANRARGILAVEMEAAALYALATAKNKNIICFAHVTNTMAQTEGDFEKGLAQGSHTSLAVLSQTLKAWNAARK